MATRHYELERVDGVPPKKDGANSMWGKDATEFKRILALRRAALNAFRGELPLRSRIAMRLEVHVKRLNQGDLDNFITGICDALMAAHNASALSSGWALPDQEDVHPTKAIGIHYDSEVISIVATKHLSTENEWYSLQLEGD